MNNDANKKLYELHAEMCKTLANPKRLEIIYTLEGWWANCWGTGKKAQSFQGKCFSAPCYPEAKGSGDLKEGGIEHLLQNLQP